MEKAENIVEKIKEAVNCDLPGKLDSVIELCSTPIWSDDPVPAAEIMLIMDCEHSESGCSPISIYLGDAVMKLLLQSSEYDH